MNDYKFGEKIYKLRKKMQYSQSMLAEMVGVSNKAVSKWETGCAKPQLDTVKKLADLFGVSVDDLLCTDSPKKSITKIVLTGGPCAGKTTAMSKIQEKFSAMGYHVIVIPETASELITGGVTPWGLNTNLDYQLCQVRLQIEKEQIFMRAAERVFGKDKILVVCDRGSMDNRAYMTDAEYEWLLSSLGLNTTELRDRYDAVFHLVTAAKGATEFYTNANNAARTETPQEAALLDDKIVAAWTGHPHLRVIDNSTEFAEKINRLLAEIALFLGEPEPCEIERKFLIEYPDVKVLSADPACRSVEIIQTYLKSDPGEEIRVRQRGEDGHYVYFRTVKKRISDLKRIETESKITKDEYLALLMEADTSKRQIRKTRYCLMYRNQYFEIDVYPFWHDRAIMEIELRTEDEQIAFPPCVKIIREVTEDPSYKNAALAER
ncbi:MAG: AAA family ATPase [Clostridia bacterium]|nr:AAA family ATPase [Clostridia bacterium]